MVREDVLKQTQWRLDLEHGRAEEISQNLKESNLIETHYRTKPEVHDRI